MVNISFWISEQFCVGLNFNQNCSGVLQKTFLPAPILQIVFYSQSMPKSLTFKVNIMFIHSRDNTSTNLIIHFHNFVFFPFSPIWFILKTAVGPTEDKCSDRRGSSILSQENVIEKNMRFVVDCEQKFIQVLPGVPDAQHQNVIWKLLVFYFKNQNLKKKSRKCYFIKCSTPCFSILCQRF